MLVLASTNVYSKLLSDKLLIAGACTLAEWPEIVQETEQGFIVLTVCPEAVHLNTIIEKVASILAKGEIKEIVVITKGGSPDCTLRWGGH